MWRRLLDACAFSSVWLAAAAAGLAGAASRALGTAADPLALALAASGTLVVYNVDRLRDVERDRVTTPERTAFVERHRPPLTALTVAAALVSAGLAAAAGPRVVALLVPVLAAGLLHRRLKRFAFAKPLYVVTAWLAVVVGLPWCVAGAPSNTFGTLAVIGTAILANAIASNIRDGEAAAAWVGARRALGIARAAACAGIAIALLGPAPLRPLVALPAAVLAVLVPFRPTERYGLLAVDGALLAGAVLAMLW